MAKLSLMCALLREAGSAFGVEIDDGEQLFLAKTEGGGWLPDDDDLDKMLHNLGDISKLQELRSSWKLNREKDPPLFGPNVCLGEDVVHVLVVVPREMVVVPEHLAVNRDTARDEDLPCAKRVKLAQVEVAYQDPVPKEFYSVPVETIDTYQKLQTAFLSRELAPLCLLYGPRQFGKTTIGHRLLTSLAADPSILVIYRSLASSIVETEEMFWLALGKIIGENTKSSEEFEDMFLRRKTRLWLAIDEMDTMFKNEKLTSNFMDCLRGWQSSKYFLGFLGIGSHDLLKMHMKVKGGDSVSPFNLAEVFQAKPFSTDQMSDFFKQIEGRYPFQDSTRQAIMGYSAGAPGVFGSLVRYSIDFDKCDQERHEWEHWFKIQNFSTYLDTYNWTYRKIREDLQKLSQSDWNLLGLLLKDDVSGSSAELGTNRENLLRMGVVITGVRDTTELEFSSEMMRRLCLEALPIREIRVVATADDPLELFAVSLRFMNPESIRHVNVKNKLSPSESVFQFELYASIRGIFKANNISSKNVLAEARYPYDKENRRLDIIVTNGVKYGYELKSNQLTETEITAAVKQADGYRQLLDISTMFMVNFVPRSHSLRPPVYSVKKYPRVKIIHVFFPDTCNEYILQFEGTDGVIKPRTKTKAVDDGDADDESGDLVDDAVVFQFNQFVYRGSAQLPTNMLDDSGALSSRGFPLLRAQASDLAFAGVYDEILGPGGEHEAEFPRTKFLSRFAAVLLL